MIREKHPDIDPITSKSSDSDSKNQEIISDLKRITLTRSLPIDVHSLSNSETNVDMTPSPKNHQIIDIEPRTQNKRHHIDLKGMLIFKFRVKSQNK